MKRIALTTPALPILMLPILASASCGSAFCTINTDWNAQTSWQNNATQLDWRMESINQNQVRSGSRKIVDAGHHQEVETYNRNGLLGLSHAFTSDVNVSVQVPVVSRDHQHIHHHHGVPLNERWDFTRLGDVSVLAHVRLDDQPSSASGMYGVMVGVKLPTGSIGVRNNGGDQAERSLQPGSGSTDVITGAYVSGNMKLANWHAQLRMATCGERTAELPTRRPTGAGCGDSLPSGPDSCSGASQSALARS